MPSAEQNIATEEDPAIAHRHRAMLQRGNGATGSIRRGYSQLPRVFHQHRRSCPSISSNESRPKRADPVFDCSRKRGLFHLGH